MLNRTPTLFDSVALVGAIVIGILAMAALTLLTVFIAVVVVDGASILSIATLSAIWASLAAGIVTICVLFVPKRKNWRRGILVASTSCLLSGVIGTIAAMHVSWSRDYAPFTTPAEVRPWLEQLVKQRVRARPDAFKNIDIRKQIRNITVHGPQMVFDPEGTRYISFDFDTGCGLIVRGRAMSVPGEGSDLTLPETACSR